MSGICGVIQKDGALVDVAVLDRLTAFMSFRGPDAQNTWVDERRVVGLGHAQLRTTFESSNESQPHSLDGKVWITADARIDGRLELIRKLNVLGRGVEGKPTDVDLILHAYHVWHEDCLQHLIGDFSFAIWDARRRQLFCARDHFGIKPFFYADLGKVLVLSNTLNCLRQHPGISSDLNELAIADFLLFGENTVPDTTSFAQIRRLPPAHCLSWTDAAGVQIRRFWELPTNLGVRYRDERDYVQHFRFLLDQAVEDRLRTDRLCVEMSGGLDSTSLAVTALDFLKSKNSPYVLRAQSMVFDSLIPHQERYFSGLVANSLNIPIDYFSADTCMPLRDWKKSCALSSEPSQIPFNSASEQMFLQAAKYARVGFAGWDGDALLSESLRPHFKHLRSTGQWPRLLKDLVAYALAHSTLDRKSLWRSLVNRPGVDTQDGYTDWLDPIWEGSLNLRERWNSVQRFPRIEHPVRPQAYTVYLGMGSSFFEYYDPGVSGQPVEYRFPLMDLRLMEYCLSLPLLPWVVKKHLLRQAMRDRLPEAVRVRPKSPLVRDPFPAQLQQLEINILAEVLELDGLEKFANLGKLAHTSSEISASFIRLMALGQWIKKSPVVS